MRRATPLLALPVALSALALASPAEAAPTLDDYRHFRALSLDLLGRIPTRAELADFEKDGFDVDAWIAANLKKSGYVDRIRQIYMDLFRFEIAPSVNFVPQATTLRRQTIMGPNGKDLYVYFRSGQRRTRTETDGVFCLTPAETGYQYPKNAAATPYGAGPHPVLQADLDAYTVVVKPWWLYSDYKSKTPVDRYDPSTWASKFAGYVPAAALLVEPDGTTPTTSIRICKEEAQTAATGTIVATAYAKGMPLTPGRLEPFPQDSKYVTDHKGQPVSCSSQLGGNFAVDCGCGVGLERCMPGDGPGFSPRAFTFTSREPLGFELPLDQVGQAASNWNHLWWGEEASRYIGYILSEDRDFREILTGHYTLVNGPLAQFYRASAPTSCCGNGVYFGYTQAEPLFDPAALPANLLPHDVSTWEVVQDRGKYASGILTMPALLVKYGSRRARAHVLYNAFKCQDFIAGNIQLKPSTEPNLMVRDGCATCHTTLEPLAAYFSRVVENDWTYLPPDKFPLLNPTCKVSMPGANPPSTCSNYYDPAFASTTQGVLRGAYPDALSNPTTQHADLGPAGIAEELVNDPAFPACAAQNVAVALLGRQLTPDDAGFREDLAQAFVTGGYKMSVLVDAVLKSSRYRASNNWTSTHIRNEVSQ